MGAKVGIIQLGTALIPALPGPSAYDRLNPGGRGRRRIRRARIGPPGVSQSSAWEMSLQRGSAADSPSSHVSFCTWI